jgi:hypothetical protein
MIADAWASALAVLGPDAGMALAAREALPVRMIARDAKGLSETISPALAAMMQFGCGAAVPDGRFASVRAGVRPGSPRGYLGVGGGPMHARSHLKTYGAYTILTL